MNDVTLLASITSEQLVAVAALVISACVAIPTIWSLRRQKPNEAYERVAQRLTEVESQLATLKDDFTDCTSERKRLERENLKLMREMFGSSDA